MIDEVQRKPELLELLRPICDDPGRRAVFLLLGSACLDLVQGVSETLAGRMFFVDVGGFSLAEVGLEHQDRLWMRGGLPRAWLAPSAAAWTRWMQSFTRTFQVCPCTCASMRQKRPNASGETVDHSPRMSRSRRRGRRWGFEFKCADAPRTTRSMHIVMDDLGLRHLWVVYPGDREYSLTDNITALPLTQIRDIELRPA